MIAQNSGQQVQKEHASEIKQLISSENLGSKFHACGDHSWLLQMKTTFVEGIT